jgi:hypothetical protein
LRSTNGLQNTADGKLFVTDPNGLIIELNFFGVSDISGWSDEVMENYSNMPRVQASP